MLVVIGTDCIGSYKSNYHMITTMTQLRFRVWCLTVILYAMTSFSGWFSLFFTNVVLALWHNLNVIVTDFKVGFVIIRRCCYFPFILQQSVMQDTIFQHTFWKVHSLFSVEHVTNMLNNLVNGKKDFFRCPTKLNFWHGHLHCAYDNWCISDIYNL